MVRLIKYLCVTAVACLSAITASSAILTVTPGNLGKSISTVGADEQELVIKGSIDATDYPALANLPDNIIKLDISSLVFEGGGVSTTDGKPGKIYSANELPDYAFFQKPITSISFPTSLVAIGKGALAETSVKSISLPAKCIEIGDYAFYGCQSLESVSSSVEGRMKVGDMAFANCGNLTTLRLPAATYYSGKEIFAGSGLKYLPTASAAGYGDYSFSSMTKLEGLELDPSVSYGKGMIMANPVLVSVQGMEGEIPDLFAAASPNINLYRELNGLENIGEYAFAGNASQTIVLSKGLNYIGPHAFSNALNLTGVDAWFLGSNLPEADETAFSGVDESKIMLYVTNESKDLWAAHPYWSRFDLRPGDSGVKDPVVMTAEDIFISSEEDRIAIKCGGPVGNFSVYSIDGKILHKSRSSDSEVSFNIPLSAGKVIVVRVDNGRADKSMTIMR